MARVGEEGKCPFEPSLLTRLLVGSLARGVAPPRPTLKIVGMKKIALATGMVLSFIGCIQGSRYFFDYDALTQYGKGFVWGSIALFLIGVVLIYFGLRKSIKPPRASAEPNL